MLRVLLVAALIALVVPVAADETYLAWDYTIVDDSTFYSYTLICGSSEDVITSFHIFAPVDYRLITEWSTDMGWTYEAIRDEETGGTDFCWRSPSGVAGGLLAGDILQVGIATKKNVATTEDYTLPGCFGNWGYEVAGWAGSVAIMPESVSVPISQVQAVPEPGSLLALVSGLGGWAALRRRRK